MSISEFPAKSIVIDHVGPIDHLTIPIPPDGGVVVLHGSSGVGKTHAIEAVSALSDQSARKHLRASDGVPSGKIDGLGVSIRLGRSNTARGELECKSLDSGLDPSVLVDPGLKDPLAADSRRLATLVRLAGVKIDAGKWAESVGRFGDEIAVKDLVSDDPVQTADKIRRRLHDVALKNERIASSKAAESAALAKSVADVNLDQETPDYQAQLEQSYQRLSDLHARRKLHLESKAAIEQARAELQSSLELEVDVEELHKEIRDELLKMDRAEADRKAILEEINDIMNRLSVLRENVSELNTAIEIHKSKADSANQRLGDAEFHLEEREKLRKAIDIALPPDASQEEFDAAETLKKTAMDGLKAIEIVHRARKTKSQADALADESNAIMADAEAQRKIARSTDGVLEQALYDAGFDTIKVHDGRLCVESDRGLEPVSELSTGERWRLALDLAARGLPKGALLSVQQEGWQSLDNDLRREVAAMAKERGLVIVTAQVSSGQLSATVFGGES